MKSAALALARDLGVSGVDVAAESSPSFIDGRCAAIMAGGRRLGTFGELHPEVITSFGLQNPVSALELDLTIM
jgi:phenylalanyl-tRNA synthetase beta chain